MFMQGKVCELFKSNQFRKTPLPLSLIELVDFSSNHKLGEVTEYLLNLSLSIIILETVIVPFLYLGQGIGYERHGTMFYRVLGVPYICLTVLFLPLYLQGKNNQ